MGHADIRHFPPADDELGMLRTPPHSIEAETSLLGGLLLDNSAWDRVGDLLRDEDFYRAEHRLIFGAIGSMINACKPADVVTVFGHLQNLGKAADVGGLSYLNGLAQYVLSAGNIRRYAEIIRERAIRRRLITAADEISSSAFNPEGKDVAGLLDAAAARMMSIEPDAAADDWEGVDEGILRLLDRIQDAASGEAPQDFIPTGLTEIDRLLNGGMRGGQLIVIGARPSMGKTALAMSIGVHVALNEGLPVGMFSMEMPKEQINNRLMSMVSRIHLARVMRPDWLKDADWPAVTEAVEKLRAVQFSVNERHGLNINQVRSAARKLYRSHGNKLGCLIVDYLGLMSGTDQKMPRAYQLEEVSKGLKGLAKELGIPVLLLVQLNREVEKRIDQVPILSDIRDAGSVEQDADVVMFVHRPWRVKPDLGDEWKPYAKVNVPKNRDGETGALDLMYVGENTGFCNWPAQMELPSSQVRTARRGGDL